MGNSFSCCVFKKEFFRIKGRVGNGGGKGFKMVKY